MTSCNFSTRSNWFGKPSICSSSNGTKYYIKKNGYIFNDNSLSSLKSKIELMINYNFSKKLLKNKDKYLNEDLFKKYLLR